MRKILTIIIFAAVVFSCSKQNKITLSEKSIKHPDRYLDSALLNQLIRQEKLNYAGENFTNSSNVDWNAVDSILREERTSCCGGEIYYSPDSLFKIYVISGESCGAYCNPFWESYVYSSENTQLSINEEYIFKDIIAIHKLPDGKYLILQQDYGRPASVLSVDCRVASIVSLEKDSILFHSLLKDLDDENYSRNIRNEQYGLSFCQEQYFSESPILSYDSLSRELNYRFGRNYGYCCQVDTDSLVEGKLKYERGKFKIVRHKVEFINNEE